MKRGPKVRTAQNAALGHKELIRHETLDAPCELTAGARDEYERLLGVLQTKGTLDRVDLAVVAECARIKSLLDIAHASVEGITEMSGADWPKIKLVGFLTTQRRYLLRELGLTTQPCRSVVRANPVGSERDDKDRWSGRLKVS
jgi:phage terminase small subunit